MVDCHECRFSFFSFFLPAAKIKLVRGETGDECCAWALAQCPRGCQVGARVNAEELNKLRFGGAVPADRELTAELDAWSWSQGRLKQ